MERKQSATSVNSGLSRNARKFRSSSAVPAEQPGFALTDEERTELYAWLKLYNMDYERLHRKFSNAVEAAKLIQLIFPSCVDLHNYRECYSTQLKKSNWETLNKYVLIQLGLSLSARTIDLLAGSTPCVAERFLYNLKKVVDAHENENDDKSEERCELSAESEDQQSDYGVVSRTQSSVFSADKSYDSAKSANPIGDSSHRTSEPGHMKCRKTCSAFSRFEEASALSHPRSKVTDERKNRNTRKAVFLDRYMNKHKESKKLDLRISKAKEILEFCKQVVKTKLETDKEIGKGLLPKLPQSPPAKPPKAKYEWIDKKI